MSGTGHVLQASPGERPDDGHAFLLVITDGRESDSRSNDSLYLDADAPVPPDGVAISWSSAYLGGGHAWWTLPGSTCEVRVRMHGTFDSRADLH